MKGQSISSAKSSAKSSVILSLISGIMLIASIHFGGTGGCGSSSTGGGGGGGGSTTTRSMSGTVDSNSLSSLTVRSRQAGLTLVQKNQSLSCEDTNVCCFGYDGTATAAEVAADCSFTLSLPLESFCYCGIFSGSDGDGDSCSDDYVADIGCQDNGFSGAIPIYADDDNTTDAIDLGTLTIQGSVAASSNDPCAQVDTDDDGTDDASDTDDDGDGTLDDSDFACSAGCMNADDLDSDDNDIPDIYEGTWDDLADADSDDLPDFCDLEECECTEEDTDCDCIEDNFDDSEEDDDGDGIDALIDCDDDDASIGYDCYEEDLCALDLDEDGVGLCDDCDDFDADDDRTFDSGCENDTCDIGHCDGNFECQLIAEDHLAAGNPICEGNNVSCMQCADGCCEVSQ